MPKLPRISGRKLERALRRAGFVRIRTVGDHVTMYNAETGRTATTLDTAKDVPVATIASALRQAGLSNEDLIRLLK